MSKKIFQSTFLVAMIVAIVTMALITAVLYPVLEERVMTELDTEISIISLGLEQGGVDYLESLQDFQRQITLVTQDGTVLYSNRSIHEKGEDISDHPAINEAMETGTGVSVKYSPKLTTQRVAYAQRLPDGTILRVSARKDSILVILFRLLFPMLLILVLTTGISVFLSRAVTRGILSPLNNLDLEHPKENKVYAELTPLLERIENQNILLRHSLETEMERREKKRSEFIANMSHEMKTPLTSISGFAELMMDGSIPGDTVKDFSKTIFHEANRLLHLVNDIIKLSMLENLDSEYKWEKIDIWKLCEEIRTRLLPSASKNHITIDLQGDNESIWGVWNIISEMIYNLVDNAIKYNCPDGKVSIRISKTAEMVSVEVKDTGIGIPKEEQERIFERFYRVDKSHSRAVGGTGLGLSIVKHGVLLHHAQVRIESDQGQGTEIALDFPAGT